MSFEERFAGKNNLLVANYQSLLQRFNGTVITFINEQLATPPTQQESDDLKRATESYLLSELAQRYAGDRLNMGLDDVQPDTWQKEYLKQQLAKKTLKPDALDTLFAVFDEVLLAGDVPPKPQHGVAR